MAVSTCTAPRPAFVIYPVYSMVREAIKFDQDLYAVSPTNVPKMNEIIGASYLGAKILGLLRQQSVKLLHTARDYLRQVLTPTSTRTCEEVGCKVLRWKRCLQALVTVRAAPLTTTLMTGSWHVIPQTLLICKSTAVRRYRL